MEIQLSDDIDSEYIQDVKYILENEEFISLTNYVHHQWTNRLIHSINVSYLSWYIAKKIGCDQKMAATAGLLHDFCPYDFRLKTPTGEPQAFFHPKAAVKNSVRLFNINQKEIDAIYSHMFPLGPLPKSKEAWIITIADKVCAVTEMCHVAIALARSNKVKLVPA